MSTKNNRFQKKQPLRKLQTDRFLATFKPKTRISNLSNGILTKILSHLDDTDDYKNARISCKTFYNILHNVKEFDNFGYISKIIYFESHTPYKMELYNIIKIGDNYPINYLLGECFLKYNKKYGTEIYYNYKGEVVLRQMLRDGQLNGISQRFSDNHLVQKTEYVNGVKNGYRVILNPDDNEMIKTLYKFGVKSNVKKYYKNIIVTQSLFRNTLLQGETVVYFKDTFKIGALKHLLNFEYGLLHGCSLVHEYDRILKLNFKNGKLEGLQAVFTNENKLKCLLTFKNGKLHGRYAFFNSFKKVEEGYNYDGVFTKSINQSNPTELSEIIYPLVSNMIDGEYIERINMVEIRLLYKLNKFAGRFIFNDVSSGESTEINFYNANNFEYRKYHYGKEMIFFKKKFGEYYLSVYNLENENENLHKHLSDRRKQYSIYNFNKIYSV
jgi:antitoxin component YwqK of YwqJK toxin-antitoxin module